MYRLNFLICSFLCLPALFLIGQQPIHNRDKVVQDGKSAEPGYDSIGNKQGEWSEMEYDFPVRYGIKDIFIIPEVRIKGFYLNHQKQGTWTAYYNEKSNKHRMLIAHMFYSNDTLQYTLFYKRNRVRCLVRQMKKQRPNNLNYHSEIVVLEIIEFNSRGRIKLHERYTPDGIYRRFHF